MLERLKLFFRCTECWNCKRLKECLSYQACKKNNLKYITTICNEKL